MIKKTHILTVVAFIFLYGLVAIWKYQDSGDIKHKNIFEVNKETPSEARLFWEKYSSAGEYRTQGDFKRAAATYDEALQLNSEHKDALYYAGSTHLLSGNFVRASHYWETLLTLEPNAPRTRLQLGTLFFCMDNRNSYFDLNRAKQQVSRAWDINREETGAPLLLAKILLFNGELKDADIILDDILATDPSNSEGIFLSGFTEWKRENTDQARQLFQQAEKTHQKQKFIVLKGEGNTETGARAMLSEGRFCDKLEPVIQTLLNKSSTSPENSFQLFSDSLESWKIRFTP